MEDSFSSSEWGTNRALIVVVPAIGRPHEQEVINMQQLISKREVC